MPIKVTESARECSVCGKRQVLKKLGNGFIPGNNCVDDCVIFSLFRLLPGVGGGSYSSKFRIYFLSLLRHDNKCVAIFFSDDYRAGIEQVAEEFFGRE